MYLHILQLILSYCAVLRPLKNSLYFVILLQAGIQKFLTRSS